MHQPRNPDIEPRRDGHKVVVVSHTYAVPDAGGWMTKNRVGELVDGLAALGWSPTFLGIHSEPRPWLSYRLADGVRVRTAGRKGLLRWLRDAVRETRSADAVLVFMPTVRTAVALILLGPRAVMYAGAAFALRPDTPRWRRWLEDLAARRAASVLAAGDQLRDRFEGVARRVEATVPMVAGEVGERLHDQAEPEPKSWDRLRLLYVGSVRRDKGVPELLDAFERLPSAELRVVGPIADAEIGRRLEQLAASSSNRLTISPYLDWPELRECYRWANVLVLASHTEGFPRIVYEATAFGVTLVVTPVGGIPHRLKDGRDALFFPVGHVDALVGALQGLAAEPERASGLSAAARRSLSPVFTEPHPSRQFARELEAVAATMPGRR